MMADLITDLSFDELTKANIKRCEESFHPVRDWSPTDWATAFAGECGEACNKIKKLRRGDDIDPKSIGLEIADTVIYADLLCTRLGLSLEDCIREAFNEKSKEVGSDIFI